MLQIRVHVKYDNMMLEEHLRKIHGQFDLLTVCLRWDRLASISASM